jgi:hypothetical protein
MCWQCGRAGHLWRECPRGPAKETVDRSDWRRDCAIGGRSEARRQIEELKARVAELEAALERKAEATTEALKEEGSEAECQRRVTCRRVRMVAAAAPDDRERAALRRGQLASDRMKARQKRLIIPTGSDGILE